VIERQQHDEEGPDPAPQPESGPRQSASESDPRNHRLVAWFKRWRKPIRQWLSHRSSVPTADLDDLAQEVFLRLLRYSDDVAIDNPQGYLFRIAANVANEWQERARHRRPHDDSWLEDLQIEFNDEPENTIAREVARYKINVNVVCPGLTETPLLQAVRNQSEHTAKIIDAVTKATPFRRPAQPEEIAEAVLFLTSPQANFITGQTLSVSGGLTMV